ncbi:MAG: dephospho-CoA kinase [Ammonifex sp.]|nr:MAG: dephospho-CoA kinase [Ammonifex sp.]
MTRVDAHFEFFTNQEAFMKVIGLTGSAGTGKTSVARCLKSLGAELIEADDVARKLTAPGQPLLTGILSVFGADMVLPDGSLDRAALRQLIFSDPDARKRLEAITHPEIIAAIETWLAGMRQRTPPPEVAVVEAPLLLETGLERLVDEVWVVIAEPEAVVRRLVARDRITPEQAQAMIAVQMPQEEKIRRANRVIDNSAGFNHTRDQTAYFYRKLLEERNEGQQ